MTRVLKKFIISEDEEEDETIPPVQNQAVSKPIEVFDSYPTTLLSTDASASDFAKLFSDEDISSLSKSKRASKRVIISDTEDEETSSTLANDTAQSRKHVKHDYEQRKNFKQIVLSPKATRKSSRISKGRSKFNENLRKLMENKRQSKLSFKPVGTNNKEEEHKEKEGEENGVIGMIDINLESNEVLSQYESGEEWKEEKSQEVEHKKTISSSNHEEEEFDLDKSGIINNTSITSIRIELEDNHDEKNIDNDTEEEETEFEQNCEESDDGLNDFIVTEEDTVDVDLPEGFTSSGTQSLEYHFKVFIQYLIYLATIENYSDVEETEYFRSSIKMIDRKIRDHSDVLVASSVWNTRFKKCLDYYPSYKLSFIYQFYCDACSSNRPANYMITLKGLPYDKRTLQPLDELDSDLLSDDDDGQKSRRGIHRFNLGKFCQIRAKIYHNLQHLKFHFFNKVKEQVNKIIKERSEPIDPNDITATFDEDGITDSLFRRFENIFDEAEKIYLNPNSVEHDLNNCI
ncbi:10759_t:CDS:2 [Ambispora leptoticha]|uniref:10759_t:CDS:1 n=1 Tax=Ambispora leptoticha TaxID=144679 RepID=A0A9N9GN39_9GLOM|nr:10759_t:CDS:2 [Ambispora leptoticha]